MATEPENRNYIVPQVFIWGGGNIIYKTLDSYSYDNILPFIIIKNMYGNDVSDKFYNEIVDDIELDIYRFPYPIQLFYYFLNKEKIEEEYISLAYGYDFVSPWILLDGHYKVESPYDIIIAGTNNTDRLFWYYPDTEEAAIFEYNEDGSFTIPYDVSCIRLMSPLPT